jgi:hypothetical protein
MERPNSLKTDWFSLPYFTFPSLLSCPTFPCGRMLNHGMHMHTGGTYGQEALMTIVCPSHLVLWLKSDIFTYFQPEAMCLPSSPHQCRATVFKRSCFLDFYFVVSKVGKNST